MTEKKTVKGMRMVVVDGEVFEVRDLEGALSTNPAKLAVVYRIDKGAERREEIGRMSPQDLLLTPGAETSIVGKVLAKWFSVYK